METPSIDGVKAIISVRASLDKLAAMETPSIDGVKRSNDPVNRELQARRNGDAVDRRREGEVIEDVGGDVTAAMETPSIDGVKHDLGAVAA